MFLTSFNHRFDHLSTDTRARSKQLISIARGAQSSQQALDANGNPDLAKTSADDMLLILSAASALNTIDPNLIPPEALKIF